MRDWLLEEARQWLMDCYQDRDDRIRIQRLDPDSLVAALEQHYQGGLAQFRQDLDR